MGLDRVLLVVASQPWQKEGRVVASATDRLDMVEVCARDAEGIDACGIELQRPGASYMVDTLQAVRAETDAEALHLILGADAAARLATWHRASELPGLAELIVTSRAGRPPKDVPIFPTHAQVEVPDLEISSTDIRARRAAGRPIDGLVPAAGVRLIRERGLYAGPG